MLRAGVALPAEDQPRERRHYELHFEISAGDVEAIVTRRQKYVRENRCGRGAVIGMGRNLGMQVVAEGVESREQLTCLQELSCPQGQGFYSTEPLTAAEFTRFLRRKEAETASATSVM